MQTAEFLRSVQSVASLHPPTKGDWYNVVKSEHYGSKESNASHHRQQKAERGTSGAFCCPSACDCYVLLFTNKRGH
jgi:hypothetical protein